MPVSTWSEIKLDLAEVLEIMIPSSLVVMVAASLMAFHRQILKYLRNLWALLGDQSQRSQQTSTLHTGFNRSLPATLTTEIHVLDRFSNLRRRRRDTAVDVEANHTTSEQRQGGTNEAPEAREGIHKPASGSSAAMPNGAEV